MKYRVTPRALRDLVDIGRYGEANWGVARRDAYLRRLEKRFQWLADSPSRGRQRNDLHRGYFCFPEGQHLVFYVVARDEIHIIGIPHQTMDMTAFFDRN